MDFNFSTRALADKRVRLVSTFNPTPNYGNVVAVDGGVIVLRDVCAYTEETRVEIGDLVAYPLAQVSGIVYPANEPSSS